MDSFYDSGKNEVLFVKIGAMVLDLQLDTCFDKGLHTPTALISKTFSCQAS